MKVEITNKVWQTTFDEIDLGGWFLDVDSHYIKIPEARVEGRLVNAVPVDPGEALVWFGDGDEVTPIAPTYIEAEEI